MKTNFPALQLTPKKFQKIIRQEVNNCNKILKKSESFRLLKYESRSTEYKRSDKSAPNKQPN
jgi:hypothetical protein